MQFQPQQLLRIYLQKELQMEGKPLFEKIVSRAWEAHLAGAAVFEGLMGFGRKHRLHTSHFLNLSEQRPICIEIVDTHQKISDFLEQNHDLLRDCLVSLTEIQINERRFE